MISDLPAELILQVLSYVPIETLNSLRLVCHKLHNILEAQEASIYRNAAVFHGFVPSGNVNYSNIYSRRSLFGVDSWKLFCKRRALIAQSWLGRQSSRLRQHSSAAPNSKVHRFKVDERRGFIVSTSSEGSLNVTDLATGETLWALDKKLNYVRRFAHCEYGEGFVVFDRMNGSKEVWRLASEYDTSPPPTSALPDDGQLDAYAQSASFYHSSRAVFRPWLLLQMPIHTRAYRFVYPSLLVSGTDQAFIFDVLTGARVQLINDLQDANAQGDGLDDINYVDVNVRHVFVCCESVLKVFSRETGRCVLEITSDQVYYGDQRFRLVYMSSSDALAQSELVRCSTEKEIDTTVPAERQFDQFVAAHVSPCGSHMALLLSCSRLIVVPNFQRIISGETTLRATALDIQLGSMRFQSIYLAYEHSRIAVATASSVFIVHFTLGPDGSHGSDIIVHRVLRMGRRVDLQYISCLQMSDTGLFVNCDISAYPDRDSIAFNQELGLGSAGIVHTLENGDRIVVAATANAIAATSTIYDLNVVPA
ncbi:hypothetical protein PLEOSDRAFT_1081654 [Pleurotus ostreatus PC15]|uniref:F-box domain-containing protein n=2 Tax=Pleurotus TaxID=5320 RepID=A0A067NPJ0_PLEO1|nr:hypothetical protein CCMSSC00406_0007607 [Pleurotus cornucopiae]KDQ29993.1 hypothetical protein PLEOSDRAFT_1081654 [Pleurotus ostreatus PC15]